MSTKVMMEHPLFYVTDAYGNADQRQDSEHGLYMKDTRFLSQYELRINGEQPELLGEGNSSSYMHTTLLKHEIKDCGAVQIKRTSYLYRGALQEQVTLTNYFLTDQPIKLTFAFDADFQDIFIVRRYRKGEVGQRMNTKFHPDSMLLQYRGKDEELRQTSIRWSGNPLVNEQEHMLEYELTLEAGKQMDIQFAIIPILNEEAPLLPSYEQGLEKLQESYDLWQNQNTRMSCSNPLFNSLYERSLQDLRMLQTNIGFGSTTVAGLPWFATVFGRDSLITSLFMLPLHPSHALGTLRTLAAYQGKEDDPWRDEEAGKIMHEIRFGELVNTGQSPFSPYYGGVDSTPLYLVLLVEYVRWTGDTAIVMELQSTIEAALGWLDRRCNGNEAGFLTYKQEAELGFPNQGWKDSSNSIVHDSGQLARAPIALIEVQGYICYAKQGLADIYASLDNCEMSVKLHEEASRLTEQIKRYFWLEDEQYFSIALDGELKPVRSITSNPGHLLLASILSEAESNAIGSRLLREDMFSGYGIRTMSNQSTGYYPMSYHNGSVWPHDNGMIMLGLLKSGQYREAGQIVSGLLQAASEVSDQRLPELFCGYGRGEYDRLVPYPTTCSPQAWSAATAFVMLQAMLGLKVDVLKGRITLSPYLPSNIQEMNVFGLTIGSGALDLYLHIDGDSDETCVTILTNTTGLDVIMPTENENRE